jgi:hypothetical protein
VCSSDLVYCSVVCILALLFFNRFSRDPRALV